MWTSRSLILSNLLPQYLQQLGGTPCVVNWLVSLTVLAVFLCPFLEVACSVPVVRVFAILLLTSCFNCVGSVALSLFYTPAWTCLSLSLSPFSFLSIQVDSLKQNWLFLRWSFGESWWWLCLGLCWLVKCLGSAIFSVWFIYCGFSSSAFIFICLSQWLWILLCSIIPVQIG